MGSVPSPSQYLITQPAMPTFCPPPASGSRLNPALMFDCGFCSGFTTLASNWVMFLAVMDDLKLAKPHLGRLDDQMAPREASEDRQLAPHSVVGRLACKKSGAVRRIWDYRSLIMNQYNGLLQATVQLSTCCRSVVLPSFAPFS